MFSVYLHPNFDVGLRVALNKNAQKAICNPSFLLREIFHAELAIIFLAERSQLRTISATRCVTSAFF